MLLLFIVIIIFLLHVQFLVRNLIFGTDELNFFNFLLTYPYDKTVAFETLMFSLSCTLGFVVGYQAIKKLSSPRFPQRSHVSIPSSKTMLAFTNFFSLIPISYMLGLGVVTGFNYGDMVAIRETSTFIFELRMVFLLLLSNILLNSGLKAFFTSDYFKHTRRLLYIYIAAAFLFQARSVVFEVLAIMLFAHIVWEGDRVRFKYVIGIAASMLIPNIIVMGRLGFPSDPIELLDGLFSFEYSVLINKFLSAAIEQGTQLDTYSFTPTLQLILPSPIRDVFGWTVQKADFYEELSALAKISSGGFSLFAEMYANFGWYASIVFCALGAIIGRLNSKAMRIGRVSIPAAIAPLLYTSFILAFRNDFGVFLKYAIQLFIIAWMLHFLVPRRENKNAGRI